MILHEPEIVQQDGKVILRARVEYNHPQNGMPDSIWFNYPEEYQPWLTERADGLAASALLTANYLGEDLEIRGSVSPRLAYGLREYQRIYLLWLPRILKPIELRFNRLVSPNKVIPQPAVASAFSGGIDSFFTLWSHLGQNQPIRELRLTHGLFAHGFDIRLHELDYYQQTCAHYQQMYQRLGLNLIPVTTNAYLFWEFRVKWEYVNGGSLIGMALNLGNGLERYLVPSTRLYTESLVLGTSPLIDHWLSTETLEIVHDGAAFDRFQKLDAISEWDEPRQHLRVCTNLQRREVDRNCGKCDKCQRTISMLVILKKLAEFETFSPRFDYPNFLKWVFFQVPSPTYTRQIARHAFKTRRWKVAIPMLGGILGGGIRRKAARLFLDALPNKWTYRIKKRLFANLAEKQIE